jgi:hypothetical protein
MPDVQKMLRATCKVYHFLHLNDTKAALPREHNSCSKLRKLQILFEIVDENFVWLRIGQLAGTCLWT